MAAKRLIPCLQIKDGRAVKVDAFGTVRDLGHPAELACRMELVGADEVWFQETGPVASNRRVRLEWVREVAHALSIPFAVGGAFLTTGEIRDVLLAGADKAVLTLGEDPTLVEDAVARFERARIVLAADLEPGPGGDWRVQVPEGGGDRRCLEDLMLLGPGQVLVRAGEGARPDLALVAAAARLPVPVLAPCDAEDREGARDALQNGADGLLLVGGLVGQDTLLSALKGALEAEGLAIRL